ncbi:MAG: hydroxymethylbilane synthase [Planctomycetota bacterium]|jgi:hydroxymethylbilane synthase
MTRTITLATRAGDLAITQSNIIAELLKTKHPDIKIEIKTITSKGDIDRKTTLWKLKTTGFFTSKLEEALIDKQTDIAVHSFKDLPTQTSPALTVAAVCDRQFTEDCFITSKKIKNINELPKNVSVGTSSLRRIVQLKRLRPDLCVVSIRGNVPTRIKKVDEGKYDAVVLARAGIERLRLSNPAPAQGAIAVQTRKDDKNTCDIVSQIDDEQARIVSLTERQILVATKCGCHAPVGAFAQIKGTQISIKAFIADQKGETFLSDQVTGPLDSALNLSEQLADKLLNSGGKEILENIQC